jgi:hypothetical protein
MALPVSPLAVAMPDLPSLDGIRLAASSTITKSLRPW